MRITIEPTCLPEYDALACGMNHKVVIEHPYDDLTVSAVMGLIDSALVAYGYAKRSVDDCHAEYGEIPIDPPCQTC